MTTRLVLAFAIVIAAAAQPAPRKLDLNASPAAELAKLPGVSPATAEKIVAGRPYTSLADLNRTGISKRNINRIAGLVTVNPPATGAADRSAPQPTTPAPLRPVTPGMVWADKDTKVYHAEGDPLYGTTRHGKYMTEEDALSHGYRAAAK